MCSGITRLNTQNGVSYSFYLPEVVFRISITTDQQESSIARLTVTEPRCINRSYDPTFFLRVCSGPFVELVKEHLPHPEDLIMNKECNSESGRVVYSDHDDAIVVLGRDQHIA